MCGGVSRFGGVRVRVYTSFQFKMLGKGIEGIVSDCIGHNYEFLAKRAKNGRETRRCESAERVVGKGTSTILYVEWLRC
jgi:hypothetical protein